MIDGVNYAGTCENFCQRCGCFLGIPHRRLCDICRIQRTHKEQSLMWVEDQLREILHLLHAMRDRAKQSAEPSRRAHSVEDYGSDLDVEIE